MGQKKTIKRIRKYLKSVDAPKWREKLDFKNYKRLDWQKRTIINRELKESL